MIPNLTTDAERNLEMLREFFAVPEGCADPQAFLRKRRALAQTLYDATQGQRYYSLTQPVTFAVVHGLTPELRELMTPERTDDDYKRFSKIDYDAILHPELHPEKFSKPSRLELIE
jgi:hypothetical protein